MRRNSRGVVRGNPQLGDVVFDWMEPARVVKVDVLQDKARQLGVTSQDIASALNGIVDGTSVTQVRDDIYLINVLGPCQRQASGNRSRRCATCSSPAPTASPCRSRRSPRFRYEIEQPAIWRRSRHADHHAQGRHPATQCSRRPSSSSSKPQVAAFEAKLPAGYSVATGGSVEESGKSQAPIVAVVPLMLFVMATILMLQLQSFQRLFLVFAVAPLALIGVVAALLPSGAPLGFVAILGVLALIGILIRNSVILVVQIEHLRNEGRPPWEAVVEATEHRMRPIMLTAAAASLALIPIAREIFWGPMAYAMMGGIIVGTVLTLLFLPALYVAWFRIKQPSEPQGHSDEAGVVKQGHLLPDH